jgi:ketosteroid isomerase-like protein
MRLATLFIAGLLAGPVLAQDDAHAGHPADVAATAVDAGAQPATAVVDRFGAALVAADFATVEALLDPDVVILESGGAERSRAEYLGHHAIADAEFLKDTHVQVTRRSAHAEGDVAWVATESEMHAGADGKPMTLLATETMVLRRRGDDWRIVHIHWSSRKKS